ncbi:MAG: glycosyltransferase family 2 protein [Sulfitobacter sp.]
MLDNKSSPQVSVIMANYNGAAHCEMAVYSVLAQSETSLELLFADDASTDDSVALVAAIAANDSRVRILSAKKNSGPAASRNRALDVAKGRWIAIVDSDDIIHPQRLEKMLEAAARLKTDGVADDLIYFGDNTSDAGATLLGASCPEGTVEVTPSMLVEQGEAGRKPAALGYLKPLLRKSSLGGLRYREDIRIGEDHDFYLRYLLSGGRVHIIGQSYYLYRRHAASTSYRLYPEDLGLMIKVQTDAVEQFPDAPQEFLDHCAARHRFLSRSIVSETITQDIKNRRLFKAVTSILRHPHSLLHLGRAAKEHFQKRMRTGRIASVAKPSDFIFLSEDQNISDFPREVRGWDVIAIPDHSAECTSQEWARVTARFSDAKTRIFGRGLAGLYALGYCPSWGCAILDNDKDDWPQQAEHLRKAGFTKNLPHNQIPQRPAAFSKRREILLLNQMAKKSVALDENCDAPSRKKGATQIETEASDV